MSSGTSRAPRVLGPQDNQAALKHARAALAAKSDLVRREELNSLISLLEGGPSPLTFELLQDEARGGARAGGVS